MLASSNADPGRNNAGPKVKMQVPGSDNVGPRMGCIKLVSVVPRIPDKLLMVRQMTKKKTTKKMGPDFLT